MMDPVGQHNYCPSLPQRKPHQYSIRNRIRSAHIPGYRGQVVCQLQQPRGYPVSTDNGANLDVPDSLENANSLTDTAQGIHCDPEVWSILLENVNAGNNDASRDTTLRLVAWVNVGFP